MLSMSRTRLARFTAAQFVRGDFRLEGWCEALQPPYSAVVAMQAVHEIRHKRHVPKLYRQIRTILDPFGCILVCDHAPKDSSPRWTSLYMTPQEQIDILRLFGRPKDLAKAELIERRLRSGASGAAAR
jgi:hypothetical protein